MKLTNKILISFCIAAFLFLASLFGTILYYYYHPHRIKSFIERSISTSTGTLCTVKTLSYTTKPLRIKAEGITLKPGENQRGFDLEIPNLKIDLTLEGPFGQKSLILKSLKIESFSFNLSEKMILAQDKSKGEGPSYFSKILKWLVASLLFRDIKLQEVEVANGRFDARFGDQMIQAMGVDARLNPEQHIDINCSMRWEWSLKKMVFAAPSVQLTTDSAISLLDPKISCLLKTQQMTFTSPEANVKNMELKTRVIYDHKQKKMTSKSLHLQLEGINLTQGKATEVTSQRPEADIKDMSMTADLIYEHAKKRLSFKPVDLSLKGIVLKYASEKELTPLNLHLKTDGILNLMENHLDAQNLHLEVDSILQSGGALKADFGPETRIELRLEDSHLLPEKVLPLLPTKTRLMLSPFHISGPVTFHGDIDGMKERQNWNWNGNLATRLEENYCAYTTKTIQLNGKVSGEIQAEGRLPEMTISANIKSDKTTLNIKNAELTPFKTTLSISGKYPVFGVKDLTAHIPQAKVKAGQQDILIDDIRIHLRNGKIDAEKQSLAFPDIQLHSSWLKNLTLGLEVDDKQTVLEMQGKNTDIIESAIAMNLLPSDWQFDGLDTIRLRVSLKEGRYCSFTSQLGFFELGFQNQDSSFMGEKISLKAALNGDVDLDDSLITANANVQVHGGEVLYERFYVDLNRNAMFSSFNGNYDMSKKLLKLVHLGVGLKDIIKINMNGIFQHKTQDQHVRFRFNIPRTSLEPIFHHLILEPFKTEKPFLNDLKTEGNISADLELEGDNKNWTVKGHCLLNNGELSWGKKDLSFQGIDLDLPICYQTRKRNNIDSNIKGALSIQSMDLPLLPKQTLSISLDAGPNRLSVTSPITLKVPGGKIRVGPILCRGIFSSKTSVDTSIALNKIEIKPLLSEFWSHPAGGIINGKLDPVHFERGTISTRGDIKANVFNGEVILSHLGASGLFTSAPLFKLNAQWKDLNLVEMTKDTSFGKVQGVLKGHLKNLEIAYGQPQRFDLLLETVKKEGVPQRISVRAVDNISRIGGGQSPFMGVAGIFASLFKEFPYEKIGIRALLENDVFRINGTIREDGQEYLVKRGGFSGVNVVNQNPDNRTSFKDMVKRIKRVTDSKSGPVVK